MLKKFMFIFLLVSTSRVSADGIVRKNSTVACLAQLRTLIGLSQSMVNVSEFTRQEIRKFRRNILKVSGDPLKSYQDRELSSDSAERASIEKMAGRLFALEESLAAENPDEKTYAIYLDGSDIANINRYIADHYKNIAKASLSTSSNIFAAMYVLVVLGVVSGVHALHGDLYNLGYAIAGSGGIYAYLKLINDMFDNATLVPSDNFQLPELAEGWHYSGFSKKIETQLIEPILENNIPGADTWNKRRFLDLIPIGLSQLVKKTSFPSDYKNKLILGDILYWRENPREPAKLIISFRVSNKRLKDEKAKNISIVEAWRAIKNLRPAPISAK